MRDVEILVVGLGSGVRLSPVGDGRVIFALKSPRKCSASLRSRSAVAGRHVLHERNWQFAEFVSSELLRRQLS